MRGLITHQNVPGVPTVILDRYGVPGNAWFVDSGHPDASTSNSGASPEAPLSTLASAVSKATANNGDHIYLMPGHAESLSSSNTVELSKAGITVVSLGKGADRGTFTLTDATRAFTSTANGVRVFGLVFKTTFDDAYGPSFLGDDVVVGDEEMPVEFIVTSDTVEFQDGVRFVTGSNRVRANIVFRGRAGGDALDHVVFLTEVAGARLVLHFDGVVNNGVVEFTGTACTDIYVTGDMNVVGTTDHSLLVVDTVGGSTWAAEIFDRAAGALARGGDNLSMGSDYGGLSLIALAVAAMQAELSGTAGITTWKSGRHPENGVSVSEVLRAAFEGGTRISRTAADIFNGSVTPLFTVAGGDIEITSLYLKTSIAAVDNTPSNVKIVSNPTSGADFDLCAVLDVDSDPAGSLYSLTGDPTAALAGGVAGGVPRMATPIRIPAGTIDLSSSADAGTGGALVQVLMTYRPLADGVTVVAA